MVGRVADVVVLSGEERRFLATQIRRYRALQSATQSATERYARCWTGAA